MKYVDADKLLAEIERRGIILDKYKDSFETAACCKQELTWMKDLIASLQQGMELPDKYQTPDWIWEDKTVEQFAEEYVEGVKKCNDAPTWDLIHTAVCYGYELGRARKEE